MDSAATGRSIVDITTVGILTMGSSTTNLATTAGIVTTAGILTAAGLTVPGVVTGLFLTGD
ncbi:hypothetical protein [Amycolatopsis sp. NPDC049868]|uniref:hypothetical protein n=1 Tax=Amycolatopsis sp. NPDC049868 TaxID=3363934 RepID=UPI0037B82BD5